MLFRHRKQDAQLTLRFPLRKSSLCRHIVRSISLMSELLLMWAVLAGKAHGGWLLGCLGQS